MNKDLMKYRVWDYKDKKFIFFDGIFNTKPDDWGSDRYSFIMRYTGKEDMFGHLIYEYDIVEEYHKAKGTLEDTFLVEYTTGNVDNLSMYSYKYKVTSHYFKASPSQLELAFI